MPRKQLTHINTIEIGIRFRLDDSLGCLLFIMEKFNISRKTAIKAIKRYNRNLEKGQYSISLIPKVGNSINIHPANIIFDYGRIKG